MKINNTREYNNLTFRKRTSKKLLLENGNPDSFEKTTSKEKAKKRAFNLLNKIALALAVALIGNAAYSNTSKPQDTTPQTAYTSTNENYDNVYADDIGTSDFSSDYFAQYNKNEDLDQILSSIIERDLSNSGAILKKSTILEGNQISDELKNEINQESTINGYIDEAIAQGITGDCWLIAGIENLSYTEAGAKYLYNSISINKDGNIEVYFKGPNLTYTITPEEIKNANNPYTLLSYGDDDMLLFEIAVNKFRKDVFENKIQIDESLPEYFYHTSNVAKNYLSNGEIRQAYWLFAGITDSQVAHADKNDIKTLLSKYKNDKNGLLSISFDKDFEIVDIEGNKIKILGRHEYGIKNVDDKNITLINPYQNLKEIVIPTEKLYDLPIVDLIYASVQ